MFNPQMAVIFMVALVILAAPATIALWLGAAKKRAAVARWLVAWALVLALGALLIKEAATTDDIGVSFFMFAATPALGLAMAVSVASPWFFIRRQKT